MKMKQKPFGCLRLAEQTLSRRPHAAPGWSGRLQSPSPPPFLCAPVSFTSLLSALFPHSLWRPSSAFPSALPLLSSPLSPSPSRLLPLLQVVCPGPITRPPVYRRRLLLILSLDESWLAFWRTCVLACFGLLALRGSALCGLFTRRSELRAELRALHVSLTRARIV